MLRVEVRQLVYHLRHELRPVVQVDAGGAVDVVVICGPGLVHTYLPGG